MNWKVGIVGLLAFALLLQGVAAAEFISVPIDPGKLPINPIKKPHPGVPEPPKVPNNQIKDHQKLNNPIESNPVEPPKIDPSNLTIYDKNTTSNMTIPVKDDPNPQPPRKINPIKKRWPLPPIPKLPGVREWTIILR